MKAYLIVTGSMFGLVGTAHLVRLVVEGGRSIFSDQGFLMHNLAIFAVGVGIAAWALMLVHRINRSGAF